MNRRSTPEADAQRAIVQALRFALPRDAIVHHCANEVTEAGPRGAKRQSILVGMGVHAGFADLIVISGGRVLFLEVKSETGRLRKSQEVFRDTVCAQGFGWALVGRSTTRWARWPTTASPAARSFPARRAAP